MALAKHDDTCVCICCNYDEDHHEDKPNWPFASEDEEHLHFDNLQRAADIRSSR